MVEAKFFKLKIPIFIATLSMLMFGFACTNMISHGSMHAPMDSMGGATDVMLTNSQQECCNTSLSKNIESWKGALLVPPREIKDGLLLLLLGLVTAFALVGLRWRHDPDDPHRLSCGSYIRDNPELALFNQLKLAFARGILNPKIY